MNDYFSQLEQITNKKETESDISFNEVRIRKVWIANISYKIKNRIERLDKQYYIDTTTGEIIGGKIPIV